MNVVEINSLVLAYLGDSIYEKYIREELIKRGIANVDDLQKEAIKYVSARSQSLILHKLLDEKFLTDEEIDIVMRARNTKSNSHPKSCSITDYKMATGLEALIGYLSFTKDEKRIEEIMNKVLGD